MGSGTGTGTAAVRVGMGVAAVAGKHPVDTGVVAGEDRHLADKGEM